MIMLTWIWLEPLSEHFCELPIEPKLFCHVALNISMFMVLLVLICLACAGQGIRAQLSANQFHSNATEVEGHSLLECKQPCSRGPASASKPLKVPATLLLNPAAGRNTIQRGRCLHKGHSSISRLATLMRSHLQISPSTRVSSISMQLGGSSDSDMPSDPALLGGAPAVQATLRMAVAALRRHTHLPHGPVPIDPELSASLLKDTGVGEYTPLLAVLPHNLIAGASGPPAASTDLRRFLVSVARPISANPVLVSVLEEIPIVDMFESAGDDKELYRLIHHCLVLHLTTTACVRDPHLAEAIFAIARMALQYTDKKLAAFERIKIFTVERSLELFDQHRLGRIPIPPYFGFFGLPFNIFEAVLQDAAVGHISNAQAGWPLVLARPGYAPASISDDSRRAVKVHMPLPKDWQHLYISWNLAFTSSWADGPYFGAALLAPCVSGAPAEEFIFHRAYAMHLQIVAHMRRRGAEDEPYVTHVQGSRDWRNSRVTKPWGDLNARAATAFFTRWRELEREERLRQYDYDYEQEVPAM